MLTAHESHVVWKYFTTFYFSIKNWYLQWSHPQWIDPTTIDPATCTSWSLEKCPETTSELLTSEMACCKTNSIAISFIVPTSKIKKNTHTHRDGNGHLLPYVTPLPPGGRRRGKGGFIHAKNKGRASRGGALLFLFNCGGSRRAPPHNVRIGNSFSLIRASGRAGY